MDVVVPVEVPADALVVIVDAERRVSVFFASANSNVAAKRRIRSFQSFMRLFLE